MMSRYFNALLIMPKRASKNGRASRVSSTTKYDAHQAVLSRTYGALAGLRRELADARLKLDLALERARRQRSSNDASLAD